MVVFKGLEVEFLISGQPAEELDDPASPDGSIQDELSRYVQAEADASFAFRCVVPAEHVLSQSNTHLSFCLYLDGAERRGRNAYVSETAKVEMLIDGGYYKTAAGPSLRALKFANLHTHDRDTPLATVNEQMQHSRNVGLATIEVWPYLRYSISKSMGVKGSFAEAASGLEVHESVAKARIGDGVLLGTTMGDTLQCRAGRMRKGKKLGTKPFATFNFKYRSKEALQQLDIIDASPLPQPKPLPPSSPPTPPPPPPPLPLEQRDPGTLNLEESREGLSRLQWQLRHAAVPGAARREVTYQGGKRERGIEGDEAEAEEAVKKERVEVIEIDDDD